MLTPGELAPGIWVIPVPRPEKERTYQQNEIIADIQTAAAIINSIAEPSIPHVILAVELPFIVVGDPASNPLAIITKIWRADEKLLKEVSPEFVQAYDVNGYNKAMAIIRRNTEMKKANKSSDAA